MNKKELTVIFNKNKDEVSLSHDDLTEDELIEAAGFVFSSIWSDDELKELSEEIWAEKISKLVDEILPYNGEICFGDGIQVTLDIQKIWKLLASKAFTGEHED